MAVQVGVDCFLAQGTQAKQVLEQRGTRRVISTSTIVIIIIMIRWLWSSRVLHVCSADPIHDDLETAF